MVSNKYFTYVRPGENRGSPTYLAAGAAKKLIEKFGKNEVINLTLGELDISPTNAFIARCAKKAAAEAASDPLYKLATVPGGTLDSDVDFGAGCNYPPADGTPELRAVAAHNFARETGIYNTAAEDVVVSLGGKAVLCGIGSTFKAGDEVIVAGSGWPTNYDFWRDGVKIIELDTNGRGLLTAEQLEQALKDHPNAKAVLINDPVNPTGVRYSEKDRDALMKVLVDSKNKDIMAIVDDPYGALTYNGAVMRRGNNEKALFSAGREVIVNSVSKVYARPDLRVGYAVTKNEKLRKGIVNYIQTHGASTQVEEQNKAQLLLLFGKQFQEETIARLEKRSKFLADRINGIRIGDNQPLSMALPQGAIYGWVNTSALKGHSYDHSDGTTHVISTPAEVAEWMRDAAHVAPVDGGPFYAPGSPAANENGWFVRIVLSNEEILERACSKLEAALGKLQGKWETRANSGAEQKRAIG